MSVKYFEGQITRKTCALQEKIIKYLKYQKQQVITIVDQRLLALITMAMTMAKTI